MWLWMCGYTVGDHMYMGRRHVLGVNFVTDMSFS